MRLHQWLLINVMPTQAIVEQDGMDLSVVPLSSVVASFQAPSSEEERAWE